MKTSLAFGDKSLRYLVGVVALQFFLSCGGETTDNSDGLFLSALALNQSSASSAASACTVATCTEIVFWSENKTAGNLRGASATARAGADAVCTGNAGGNKPANVNDSNVHAVISISAADSIAAMPTTHSFSANLPVKNVAGTATLGTNWADLLDGNIAMTLDAAGVLMGSKGTNPWWSGSNASGNFDATNNCSGWTNGTVGASGMPGAPDTNGPGWLVLTPANCANLLHILCMAAR